MRRLAEDLTAAGVTVWLDEREIGVGDPISQRIQEGIASADYVAVWLTQRAVNSEWVQREWGAKLNREIAERDVQVLPLLAESCDRPALLVDKKYAGFRDSYDDGLDELLAKLGVRRHWTQQALEAYLVQHHCPNDFERMEDHGPGYEDWDEYRLITESTSPEGWRPVLWNSNTNRLEVWERPAFSRWWGPDPLTENDIREVLQRLRGQTT